MTKNKKAWEEAWENAYDNLSAAEKKKFQSKFLFNDIAQLKETYDKLHAQLISNRGFSLNEKEELLDKLFKEYCKLLKQIRGGKK